MHSEFPTEPSHLQQNGMLSLHVVNETSPLKAVVVGTAKSCGPTPKSEEAYDPKSLQHILAGTYPLEGRAVKF